MAIKLRKFSCNTLTKFILFTLVVIMLTGAVVYLQFTVIHYDSFESLEYENYTDSDSYKHLFIDAVNKVCNNATDTTNTDSKKNEEAEIFRYYIKWKDKTILNNVDDPISVTKDSNYYLVLKNNNLKLYNKNEFVNINNPNVSDWVKTAYVSFPNDYIVQMEKEWNQTRKELMDFFYIEGLMVSLSFILIILLIVVTGKRSEDNEVHLNRFDSLYLEFLAFVEFCILYVWFVVVRESNTYLSYYPTLAPQTSIFLLLTGALSSITLTISGAIVLTLVRRWKARTLLRQSITFIVLYRFYDLCKSLFDGRVFAKFPLTKSLFYRQLVFIVASMLQVFLTFLFLFAGTSLALFPVLIEFVIVYWYIEANNKTYEEINKGFNASIEEQMRAERMKIDLVTNVSHDLKTPLTSIISYVDLLSKEENLSESAKDYVHILGDKSERLKKIVEDLFDLAKATSGNITLSPKYLDMKKLIEQTIADMADSIEQLGRKLVSNLPSKQIMVYADGDKMYRVFQNIIDNALKYSLDNTRIFVDVLTENDTVTVSIRNTANYEMDFTAKEIIGRFHRGDKSRSTDGSGLGLSIAESFTNACGGTFKVIIEGDSFMIKIGFKEISKQYNNMIKD